MIAPGVTRNAMSIPLPFKQGKPLPPDFPYEGQWLMENRIFIYRPKDSLPGSTSPRFTASGPSPEGWLLRL
jgi:hypothetical protein